MKHLLFAILSISLFTGMGCNKKNKEPEQYFSFYADGEFIDYPYECSSGIFGGRCNIGAVASTPSVGYMIYGESMEDPTAPGEMRFFLAGNQLPDKDTIILDGSRATLTDFRFMGNNYYTTNTEKGVLIFSKRTSSKLEGTFEFTARQQYNDSIIHITRGKFSIIP